MLQKCKSLKQSEAVIRVYIYMFVYEETLNKTKEKSKTMKE